MPDENLKAELFICCCGNGEIENDRNYDWSILIAFNIFIAILNYYQLNALFKENNTKLQVNY
jgi:hypothetical protein